MASFRSRESWRRHPLISNGMSAALPGLRRAAVIFAGYVVLEKLYQLGTTPVEDHRNYDTSRVVWERAGVGARPQRGAAGEGDAHDDHGHGHGGGH